jgi:hypothetical protein
MPKARKGEMRRKDSGASCPNRGGYLLVGIFEKWRRGGARTCTARRRRPPNSKAEARRRRGQLGGRVAEIRSGRLEAAYLARFGRRLAFSFSLF